MTAIDIPFNIKVKVGKVVIGKELIGTISAKTPSTAWTYLVISMRFFMYAVKELLKINQP